MVLTGTIGVVPGFLGGTNGVADKVVYSAGEIVKKRSPS